VRESDDPPTSDAAESLDDISARLRAMNAQLDALDSQRRHAADERAERALQRAARAQRAEGLAGRVRLEAVAVSYVGPATSSGQVHCWEVTVRDNGADPPREITVETEITDGAARAVEIEDGGVASYISVYVETRANIFEAEADPLDRLAAVAPIVVLPPEH